MKLGSHLLCKQGTLGIQGGTLYIQGTLDIEGTLCKQGTLGIQGGKLYLQGTLDIEGALCKQGTLGIQGGKLYLQGTLDIEGTLCKQGETLGVKVVILGIQRTLCKRALFIHGGILYT